MVWTLIIIESYYEIKHLGEYWSCFITRCQTSFLNPGDSWANPGCILSIGQVFKTVQTMIGIDSDSTNFNSIDGNSYPR